MLGRAAVTIWCDVAREAPGEFDDWHAREHMPERLEPLPSRRGLLAALAEGEMRDALDSRVYELACLMR